MRSTSARMGEQSSPAGGSEEVFNTTLERILILWDVASGKILQRFEGHTAPVTTVAFSPDGKTTLSGSSDLSLILWGLTNGAEIQRFEGHTSAVNSAALSADGQDCLIWFGGYLTYLLGGIHREAHPTNLCR